MIEVKHYSIWPVRRPVHAVQPVITGPEGGLRRAETTLVP